MLKITKNSSDSKAFWLAVANEAGHLMIDLGNKHGPISLAVLEAASKHPPQSDSVEEARKPTNLPDPSVRLTVLEYIETLKALPTEEARKPINLLDPKNRRTVSEWFKTRLTPPEWLQTLKDIYAK